MNCQRIVIFWIAILVISILSAYAQPNAPHIGFVYPAGGRKGTTFRVQVGGQFLDGTNNAFFSGNGIHARVVELTKPLPQQKLNELREQVQELQKKGKDPAIMEQIAQIRETIVSSLNRRANPVLSESAILEVTVNSDAAPGKQELRLKTPLGLSNPLVFCVGQLPEFLEKEPKNSPRDRLTDITIPAVINGRLIPGSTGQHRLEVRQQQAYMPGDVDRYRFTARKGQHLVAAASARELIPYLADAVPGWLQAVLTLYDSSGYEVAYNDDFTFHPDPVLQYDIPKDGEYVIEIRDAIYRGREDFVYRIAIGEIPFLTSIFPLGGQAGRRAKIAPKGWNLPVNEATLDTASMAPGIYPFSVSNTGGMDSNVKLFQVDTLPECLEKEPNNSIRKAQRVALPIIVNGRIDRPGDWDVYSFKGSKGEQFVAEIYARRLDSPLDSVLKLTDAQGRQLAFNDDHEDKGFGLETHHADSYVATTLPADDTYYVFVGDVQHHGGPEYAYRLRMSAPRPDFDLRIVPSAVNALAGPTVPITVYALRKDGFSGEIALELQEPNDFALNGGLIPANQEKIQLTLTVPLKAMKEPVAIRIEGRARIQGKDIIRVAMPADDLMQAFAYRHLVPASDLKVTATGRGPSQAALKVLADRPLKIPAGGPVLVQVSFPALGLLEKVQFDLNDPPEGISIKESALTKQGGNFLVQCDAAKARPGLKGNLIVTVSGERTPPQDAKGAASTRRQRVPLGTLPAIPFEIVEQK